MFKKTLILFLGLFFLSHPVFAINLENGYDSGPLNANQVKVNTTNFSKNLSSADSDVQHALETIDQMAGGGGSGSGNVGIGTTGRIPVYIGTTTIGSPYANVMDSNGNIGIGSTSPGTKLDILNSVNLASPVRNFNLSNGNAATSGFEAYSDGASGGLGVFGTNFASVPAWADGVGFLGLGTESSVILGSIGGYTSVISGGTTERIRITATGNVGIGTTVPGDGLVIMNGNVGIGTWKPLAQLEVKGGHVALEGVTSTGATGTGKLVFDLNPTLGIPEIGSATGTSLALIGNIGIGGGGVVTNPLELSISQNANTVARVINLTDNTAAGAVLDVRTAGSVEGLLAAHPANYTTIPSLANGVSLYAYPNLVLLSSGGYTAFQQAIGVEKMRIDPNGNVGIGSIAPSKTLDVVGTIRASTDIGIGTYSVCTTSGNCPSAGGGSTNWANSGSDVTLAGGNVGIGTTLTTTSALSIMNGNVGIGTWKPTQLFAVGANALTVTSAGALAAGATTVSTIIASSTSQSNSVMTAPYFVDSSGGGTTNPYRLDNAGASWAGVTQSLSLASNAGIGTFVANNTLSVLGGVGIGNAAGSAFLQNSNSAGQLTVEGNVGIGTTIVGNGALSIMTGNVGIGTWVPNSPLHVGSNIGFQVSNAGSIVALGGTASATITSSALSLTTTTAAGVINNNSTAGSSLLVRGASAATSHLDLQSTSAAGTSDYIDFLVGNAGATKAMRINTSGNVGLGTTNAGGKMTVVGNIGIGTVKDGDSYINTAPPNGGMIIEGNVGIGTLVPASKLTIGTGNLMQKVSVTNQACSTTCGNMACFFGEDTVVLGTLGDCSDATMDVCFCSK